MASSQQEGRLQLKTINRLSFAYAFNDFDSAMYYIDRSMASALKNEFDSMYTEATNIKGIIYDINGNTDSSEFYFLKTYDLSLEHEIKTYEAFSLNNLGMMYERKSDFDNALEYFFKALALKEESNDNIGIGAYFNNVGWIYQQMNQTKKAISYHQKAMSARKKEGLRSELIDSYNNMGICYKELEKIDSAIYFYNLALEIALQGENKQALGKIYSNLGIINFIQGDFTKAKDYMLKSKIGGEIDPREEMIADINLCGIYYGLGQYEKGIYHGILADKYLNENDVAASGVDVYKFLSLNYAATRQRKNALGYIRKYKEISDSIFSTENANVISKLEVEYETEKKERLLLEEKSKSAELEKEVAISELKISNRNNWLIGSIGGVLSILFLSLFVIQKQKRKTQKEKDQAIISERDKGTKAVIRAQENERKRISKDLHDGIGQQLSGLKLAWSGLSDSLTNLSEEEKKKINSLTEILDDSAKEVRNISHQMMPRVLQEIGLVPAISDMLEKTFQFSDIKCEFEQFNFDEKRFDSNLEISLYRITQELINNCIKHANATNVAVQLINHGDNIMLIVEDNGNGIKADDSKSGNGLMNIRSRVNTLSGKVIFEPSPNSGTLATVKIPI